MTLNLSSPETVGRKGRIGNGALVRDTAEAVETESGIIAETAIGIKKAIHYCGRRRPL